MSNEINLGKTGEEVWYRFADRRSVLDHRHETFVPEDEYDDVVEESLPREESYTVWPDRGERSFSRSTVSKLIFRDDEREEVTAEMVP